jgi:hypothetical protein
VRRFLYRYRDPESLSVKSLSSGLECALFLFCAGAVFLSLEHFEMPYILLLLAMQLHAITRAIAAKTRAAMPQQVAVATVRANALPAVAVAR